MFFFLVDATNVELPRFTLCKWTSSDDPEKNSGEAKSKNEELSPTKAEKSPQARNEGKSQKFGIICGSTFLLQLIVAYECWLVCPFLPFWPRTGGKFCMSLAADLGL